MVTQKEKRNKEFIKSWKNLGLGNEQLAERFSMSVGGVKSLKSRLRKRMPELYSKAVERDANEGVDALIRLHRKVSFYMSPELVIKLKVAAAQREVTMSELAESWLRRVMAEQGIL